MWIYVYISAGQVNTLHNHCFVKGILLLKHLKVLHTSYCIYMYISLHDSIIQSKIVFCVEEEVWFILC